MTFNHDFVITDPKRKVVFFLIRHAECEMNLQGVVSGRCSNSPLTELGHQQAKSLGNHLRINSYSLLPVPQTKSLVVTEGSKLCIDRILTSPAIRATHTTELVLREMGIRCFTREIVESLHEMDQGNWMGLSRKKCYTPKNLKKIDLDPSGFCAPGGESKKEVESRMCRLLHRVALEQLE